MERVTYLLFSVACALVMGVFWGCMVWVFHPLTGQWVGLALFLLTLCVLLMMGKGLWATKVEFEVHPEVPPQDGKVV